MKKLLKLKWLFFSCILLLFQCRKVNNISDILTKEDTTYWDYYRYNELTKDKWIQSISFSKEGKCIVYFINIYGKRQYHKLGDYSKSIGLCDTWRVINDSIINIRCQRNYKYKVINDSTISLIEIYSKEKKILHKSQKDKIKLK